MESTVRYVRVCLGCKDREEYTLHWTRRVRRDPDSRYKEEEYLCPPCQWKLQNFLWYGHCQARQSAKKDTEDTQSTKGVNEVKEGCDD